MAHSVACRDARAANLPHPEVDASLPIAAHAKAIIEVIRRHPVLVLAGATGSGKTTQLPKLCLAAGRGTAGLIGCTQPRRLAARSMARRVATELGGELGGWVGYQVRFQERLGPETCIKFMTDGILLAATQSDRELAAYDTLIIDEAHERTLNIDFLLGYLKTLLPRRPDLKLIITSATIDTARFAAHFNDAPVIEVEGRSHPVEVRWRPPAGRAAAQPSEPIAKALDEISAENSRGDVLVFLPGEREIRDTHLFLERRGYRHTEIVPLYGRLSAKEQDRVFHPGPARRIVLTTNVAETSLTVPRIRYVIDTGVARVKRYSTRRQIDRLDIEPISQAAADQRKGRCGRIGPGVCVRLYAEEEFITRPHYTDPEIRRSALAGVILRMLSLGLGKPEGFPFLDPPQPRSISEGWQRLVEVGAVDGQQSLTRTGRDMAKLPLDVHLARMLLAARDADCVADMLAVSSFLSVQDPRERPADERAKADAAHALLADPNSDFVGILRLWEAFNAKLEDSTQAQLRDWCRCHYLSFLRLREWRALHRQLRLQVQAMDWTIRVAERLPVTETKPPAPPLTTNRYQALHLALLAGLPTHVAKRDEKGLYRGTRERSWQIFPGSALARKGPRWLFSAQVLDLGGRVYGMLNARIEPAWIERQAAHLLKHRLTEPHWSRQRGAVMACEQITLFGLVLVERRPVTYHRFDPDDAHRVFLLEGLAECALDSPNPVITANRRVLEEAGRVQVRLRRDDLLKSALDRKAFFHDKLPTKITTRAGFETWYRRADTETRAALRWTLDDVLELPPVAHSGLYPPRLELAGQALQLEYRFVPGDTADGVSLRVPLARLNTLSPARLDWLVPGLLTEKVTALIRTLPKPLRRNVVPAPDFARAFCTAVVPHEQPLVEALATYLQRISGVTIQPPDFDPAALPEYLRMHIAVVDEHDHLLAAGRNLEALRAQLGERAHQAFATHSNAALDTTPVTTFRFETIPVTVSGPHGLPAWPALVDLGESVALHLFEQADEARIAHHDGVLRLLRTALVAVIKRARRQLPINTRLALQWTSQGRVETLREELVEGGLQDLLAVAVLDVRGQGPFEALRERLASELFNAAVVRLQRAEPILALYAELHDCLLAPTPGFARASYDDLHSQLQALLQPGFLQNVSTLRLGHYPRYLKAMHLRIEQLRQDPVRDQRRLLEVLPYCRALHDHQAAGATGAACERLRWLIEEWRVSVFAQQLGTAERVSGKRLKQALNDLSQQASKP